MIENLTNDNFLLYAAKFYISPHYIEQEFFADLKRIKYIKRLIQKYRFTGELKERLILNHIIVIYNLFGAEAATKMLFFKIEMQFWPQLKTFLVFLNYMPVGVIRAQGVVVEGYEISVDERVAEALERI